MWLSPGISSSRTRTASSAEPTGAWSRRTTSSAPGAAPQGLPDAQTLVSKRRIAGVKLLAPTPPVAKNSSGLVRDAITAFVSNGHHVKGSVSRDGSVGYTFTEAFTYGGNKATNTDTITLKHVFTSAKRATGTFRDISDYTAASATGKGRRGTGKLKFTVSQWSGWTRGGGRRVLQVRGLASGGDRADRGQSRIQPWRTSHG